MDDSSRVRVFDYLDFRAFLRDRVAAAGGSQRFSLRALSRRAGLRSTNYLSLALKGERTPSVATAQRLAGALGLRKREAEYFCELVSLARAETADARGEHHARLSRLRNRPELRQLDTAQADYHSHWYIPAVRELVAADDFREDSRWIAHRLLPAITKKQAEHALHTLLELGLLRRDERGRLQQADALITTGSGPLGHHVVGFHRAMLDRASASLDAIARDEREISALTMGVSHEMLLQLKQRIREFRRDLLHIAQQSARVERVVQINFQLFPLSRKPGEDDV